MLGCAHPSRRGLGETAAHDRPQANEGAARQNKARGLLAPVYNRYTEGFDTLELKEAKVLLDVLAS